MADDASSPTGAIDLYWLPLGAGGYVVRRCGRAFEMLSARVHGHRPQQLYHSALKVRLAGSSFVIEQAPVPHARGLDRGVVGVGAVGAAWAGRARIFRYEVRRWRDGTISDEAEAVASPVLLTDDPARARRILKLADELPLPTWGRDELDAGEMWNSNSIVAWLIEKSGLDASAVSPPAHGRAPGWNAGIVVARRA